ncbi:hypothetical protein [Xanthomonas campestris]|uniref:hypothetical protein n=2 Tax=Xanthomonas campestris TaxID=339 RepID=UPI0020C96064|nr:hypothetical protein [Xanthomonas campestris]MDM7718724.1 hypothetical protein [Xanthomonas campestris pv. campestris]MEA0953179.1 hypothetical protein [Xanthomonas campestris pv. campestris]MEB1105581.1 hypothetical protein [Xanthomonas campestris pv. campestris]MEB1623882.1 hypothetical protein [Xanthomonas campestris pv. campestris]
MANWVDLAEHDLVLLWRPKPGCPHARQMVLQTVTSGGCIPPDVVEMGFLPEGAQYVRDSTVLLPDEFLHIFPRARMVDVPRDFFQHKPGSNIVHLSGRPAPELAVRVFSPHTAVDVGLMRWALTPLPRFIHEARTLIEDGASVVSFGGMERLTRKRGTSASLKSLMHALAVRAARDAGAQLPFQVMVDYPDYVYFGGARRTHAAYRANSLVARLAVAERLNRGACATVVSTHTGVPDLVLRIEQTDRHAELVVAQTSVGAVGIAGVATGFEITRGRLHLAWTSQAEQRGFDPLLASLFLSSLLSGGYEAVNVRWDRPVSGAERSTAAA